MNTTLNIALLGFGHVGKGFFELQGRLKHSPFRIAAIAERNPEKLPPPLRHLFLDSHKAVQRRDIDIVVEATNAPQEAFDLVKTALNRGARVVSANKKMLARHLPELEPYIHSGRLKYEAAACASIPVFRILETFYFEEPVVKIRGILNGTCNYLLTQMEATRQPIADLISEAQALGYAEADPTDDVDAWDTLYKLILLVRSTWGLQLSPEQVERSGILGIRPADVAAAAARGERLKLIAEADMTDGKLRASVGVRSVTADDPLYHVSAENNILQVFGAWSGPQHYTGRGAGSLPTGKALLQDVLDLSSGSSFRSAN
jgi:homoserine dehydrogenase